LNTVRAQGANNVCIIGGEQYSYYYVGMSPVTDTASGNGIVYSAHIYNNKSDNTSTGWQTNIDPALAYGPVLVEEFGNSANTTDNGNFVNSIFTWMNGTNDKNYVYGGMAWDLDLSAGPPLLTAWSSTLSAPVSSGSGWVLTSYEGQQVYGWLKGLTHLYRHGDAHDVPNLVSFAYIFTDSDMDWNDNVDNHPDENFHTNGHCYTIRYEN
jgi:hypothetical protein